MIDKQTKVIDHPGLSAYARMYWQFNDSQLAIVLPHIQQSLQQARTLLSALSSADESAKLLLRHTVELSLVVTKLATFLDKSGAPLQFSFRPTSLRWLILPSLANQS